MTRGSLTPLRPNIHMRAYFIIFFIFFRVPGIVDLSGVCTVSVLFLSPTLFFFLHGVVEHLE